MWNPVFECVVSADGERGYRVGHELIDEFLEFVAGRARYAHDLKVFFSVVGKEPEQVTARDVMAFVTDQRRGRAGAENVVRITDAFAGLAAATIAAIGDPTYLPRPHHRVRDRELPAANDARVAKAVRRRRAE